MSESIRIREAQAHCAKCAKAYRQLDAHGGLWVEIVTVKTKRRGAK